MTQILITAGFFLLILISLFLLLVVLMQRANTDAGLGSAFGGGITESAFGTETTNILQRATRWAAIAFFIIAFALYLGILAERHSAREENQLIRFQEEAAAAEQAAPAEEATPEAPAVPATQMAVPYEDETAPAEEPAQ